MKALIIYFAITWHALAEPLRPYSLMLNKGQIEAIPIHNEIDTLLIFPEDVESIVGKGLTSGAETLGTILYKQGEKNPKTIILRHLDNSSKVLMTIMIKNEAFVFRLEPSLEPASVIYLNKAENLQDQAREITPEEALIRARPISEKRKLELFRLSKEAHFLKSRVPKFYAGYSEKQTSLTATEDRLKTSITRLTRFANEDALLFFGTIQNASNKPIDLARCSVTLKVGKRGYQPSKLRADQKIIAPGASVKFEGLLLGNGQGSPLHLSLDNKFILHLKQNN